MEALREQLRQAVRAGYGEYTPFYWNTGEAAPVARPAGLPACGDLASSRSRSANYLTLIQRYKQDASVIGFKHFRVTTE